MGSSPLAPALLAPLFADLSDISYVIGGGQKSVYRAQHKAHGAIALKVFSDFSDEARVRREIEAVRQIQCANVPPIFASGFLRSLARPCFWLTEPWLQGENLQSRLASGPLPSDVVLRVALDVSLVLAEAEKKNIVHRDVKPANIFLDADNSKCWLLDFGIARHLDLSTLTRAGTGFGPMSAGYAPREQIQNFTEGIDSRTDIFALGVTLYEALMGFNPFLTQTSDLNEVLRRVMQTELPRPTREVDSAGEFSDLVMVMTRARRSLRPRSAAKVHDWFSKIKPQ